MVYCRHMTNSIIPFMEPKFENLPFMTLDKGVEKCIKAISDADKGGAVQIIVSPTGVGKSHEQDTLLRDYIGKYHPKVDIILRLSPTRDVADDGVYSRLYNGWRGYGCKTASDFRKDNGFLNVINQDLELKQKLCISLTHGSFLSATGRTKSSDQDALVEWFVKNQHRIFLVIEEAHKYLACPCAGGESARFVFGNAGTAPYFATMPNAIKEWVKTNPRVIAFTATPSVAQNKTYGIYVDPATGKEELKLVEENPHLDFEYRFDVVNCFPKKLEELLPHQAWLKPSSNYTFYKGEPERISYRLRQSVDQLLEKERALETLKQQDNNINSKRVWLGVFGNTKGGAWSSSPNLAKQFLIEHLKELGFNNDFYIATMTEKGGYTYDLNDSRSSKYSEKELIAKLNDPHDPVRFLLCINIGTAGLNVHRLGVLFVARVKNIIFDRTENPLQTFGRMVRIATGTDVYSKSDYNNDLRLYIHKYHKEYGVPLDVIVETLKVANTFNITYPIGIQERVREPYVPKDIWGKAIEIFEERYCNGAEDGEKFLDDLLKSNGIEVCSLCGSPLTNAFHTPHDDDKNIEKIDEMLGVI